MNYIIKSVTIFKIVLLLSGTVSSTRTCNFSDELSAIAPCNAILYQPICLLCNANMSSKNVRWYVGNQKLADKGHNFNASHAGGLAVNKCGNGEYHSVRLQEPSTQYQHSRYYCQHNKKNVSTFILNLQADAELFINTNLSSDGHLLLGQNESEKELQCLLKRAVPPLTLVWSINDVVKGTRTFNSSMESTTTYNFTMAFGNLTAGKKLTCSSRGTFVDETFSLKVYFSKKDKEETVTRHHLSPAKPTKPEGNKTNLNSIWIFSGLPVVLASSFLAIFLQKRKKERNSFNVDIVLARNGQATASTYEPYSQIGDVTRGIQSESDNGLNGAETMCLLSKIKFSGIYEYWSGTYKAVGTSEIKCFVKSLSGQSTLHDACEFQVLAKKVKHLVASAYTVRVLCININENPFSIAYELLEYGSLRDFVMSRYQQSQTSATGEGASLQSRELLTFAANIAKAMIFVESQDFLHPVLTLKKVLLDSHCCCKLYDIFPSDMAMTKIEKLLKKNYPPVAWISPETIFLREYSQASDVWSFSTLMWELFSFGEIPYAGKNEKEIEANLRRGILLEQPHSCPETVYDIMIMAWSKNSTNRPSFDVVLEKLQECAKSFHKDETSDVKSHFTLETIQAGDYI